MRSFAKVLSGVPKKSRVAPVAQPRILIPVDSRVIALGSPRIATVDLAAGQGWSRVKKAAVCGSWRGAGGRRGNLIKSSGQHVPACSGRTVLPCSRLLVSRCRSFRVASRNTKLGFVNFWSVNSLKGISARRELAGDASVLFSIWADDLATGQGREERKKCESFLLRTIARRRRASN
jgi:hypothetical protein